MSRVEHGVVGELLQCLEAVVHRAGIAAWEIDPPAAVEKKRIAGDELPVLVLFFDVKTLAARRVSGRMNEPHADPTEFEDIAATRAL